MINCIIKDISQYVVNTLIRNISGNNVKPLNQNFD